MHAYEFPKFDEPMVDFRGKNVAVIGGGNTALDAIRSSLRLGAGNAFILYRRSETEMPARLEEVKHAKEEGIELQMLTAPLEFLDDGKGWLTGRTLSEDGTRRTGLFGTPPPGANRRLGIRDPSRRGHHGDWNDRQSNHPDHHARLGDHKKGLYPGRRHHAEDFAPRSVCRAATSSPVARP